MKDLHATLPFSNIIFFYFIIVTVALMYVCKVLFKDKISFKTLLTVINTTYILLFFTKPIQIVCLMLYFYVIYFLFSKVLKYQKLLLPVLLLALPMVGMKIINIIPADESVLYHQLSLVFQIAGISFMTFKAIQLYIDEGYKTERVPLIDFFNFLAFVPTLLIGPLDRYARFTENVESGFQQINGSNFSAGWNDLMKGLLYKFIIAHAISTLLMEQLVNDGSWLYHCKMMYTYLFYLFFDFAGYSLLAIGFGKMIGIQVPTNFDKPFVAVNPKDFWKRWHITLGDWLNDYFFKPIFKELTSKKKFKPIQRQNIALFTTFFLMGCWNGFEKHFILSGAVFGIYSVIHNYYVYLCKKNGRDVFFGTINHRFVKLLSILIMLNGVALAIYIFSGKINYIIDKLF